MKQCKYTINQLMAYLDDAAEPDVQLHVAGCAACQRKVRELSMAQQRFGARLIGHQCPSTMELGEYHLRTVSWGEIRPLRSHVRNCSDCLQRLNEIAAEISAPYDSLSAPHSVSNQNRSNQNSTENQSPNYMLPPQIAYPQLAQPMLMQGVRGRAAESTMTYSLTQGKVSIRLQSGDKTSETTVTGLLLGVERFFANVRLLTAENSREVAQSVINRLGGFTLDAIASGEYELEMIPVEGDVVVLRELNI